MKSTKINLLYIILAFFCLSNFKVWAQPEPNLNLYNFKNVGQSMLTNPGIIQQSNFTLSLTPSIYLNYDNPGFTVLDIFKKGESADTAIQNILSNPDKNFRNINLNANLDLLYLGFRIKKNFFSFGVTVNAEVDASLPKDLVELGYLGNASPDTYWGKVADLSAIGANINIYNAYHFGYAREVNDKLTIGGRLKLLHGIGNLTVKKSDLFFQVDSGVVNPFRVTASADYEVNGSGINEIQSIMEDSSNNGGPDWSKHKDFIKPKIDGLGLDLGFNYKLNKKWSFSGSVIDLGYINWTRDTKKYIGKGYYSSEGVDYNVDSTNNDAIFTTMIDSVSAVFKPTESESSYKTNLNTRVYLGAQYNFTPASMVGATFLGQFLRSGFKPAVAISYTQKLWWFMDVRVNWSYYNQKFDNVGAGLSMNIGPVQWYVFADNAYGAYTFETTNWLNFRTGVNLNFGRNYDRDGDGIPNKKDKCKKVYGLKAFKGCPDTDGDGIEDALDDCPTVKGTILAKGCPDRDNDGINDSLDACPNDSGLVSLKGCPDADNDGIADKDDKCPNIPGIKEFNGCPDTDGDGVEDAIDECPNEKGKPEFNGCPDFDNDSVEDRFDSCRFVAGLAIFNGCPDSDGDSIPDHLDDCPKVAGPKENKGCPVIEVAVKKLFEKALQGIQFETGKAVIKSTSFGIMDEIVKVMVENPDYRIFITGHTDNVGDSTKNMDLSKERATAVKNYLLEKGVDFKRISSEGFGDTKPVADNATKEGRAKNRRVEFTVQFEDFVQEEPKSTEILKIIIDSPDQINVDSTKINEPKFKELLELIEKKVEINKDSIPEIKKEETPELIKQEPPIILKDSLPK